MSKSNQSHAGRQRDFRKRRREAKKNNIARNLTCNEFIIDPPDTNNDG